MSGFGWDDEAKDRSWNRGSREEFERQWARSMHQPPINIATATRGEEKQMSLREVALRSEVYKAIDSERAYQDTKWRPT